MPGWRHPASLAWAAAGLVVALCMAYVGVQQFGALRGQALQIDELFFGACASRAAIDGWAATAGCHDNKAPLIYLLHAALQQASRPYDPTVLKLASLALLGAITALSMRVARRAATVQPARAAVASALLLLCALVPNPAMLAVKTELLGVLFLLCGLAIAPPAGQRLGALRALCIGLAFGAAVMSKQSYVLMLPAGLWLVWIASPGLPAPARGLRLLAFCAGSVLPGLLLAALFAASGSLLEFWATTFLYPAVYGAPLKASLAKRLLWQFATLSEFVQLVPIQLALALTVLLRGDLRSSSTPAPQRALLLACGLTLLILLASPKLFPYHAIPFWVLASTLAGPVLAQGHAADGWGRSAAAAALLGAAVLGLGITLRTNDARQASFLQTDATQAPTRRHAFVIGMAPEFYAAEGFIPASRVQFPWALPGTPPSWAYHPPQPGSQLHTLLQAQQQRNLAQLYTDFARTPPAYIFIFDKYARAEGSPRQADVPGFDDYLARHCQLQGEVSDSSGSPGRRFACDAAR